MVGIMVVVIVGGVTEVEVVDEEYLMEVEVVEKDWLMNAHVRLSTYHRQDCNHRSEEISFDGLGHTIHG